MSSDRLPKGFDSIKNQINEYIESMGLPDSAFLQAVELYKLSYRHDLYRGRSLNAVIGTSIYAASLLVNDPRPPSTISETLDVKEEELFDTLRHFKKNLELPIPVASPKSYLYQIDEELDLSEPVIDRAEDIIEKSTENNYASGKSATGIAASSVYIAASERNENLTQKELSETVGVTTVTIRNRYQEQLEFIS